MPIREAIREMQQLRREQPQPARPDFAPGIVPAAPAFSSGTGSAREEASSLSPAVPGYALPPIVNPSDPVNERHESTPPVPLLPEGSFVAPQPSHTGVSDALPSPAPATGGSGSLGFVASVSGGNSEVVALLKQLVAGQRDGGTAGRQREARIPSPPGKLTWHGSWEADREGYASGASPSFDVSNRAGIGGASSLRGFGSNLRGHRYLQPDGEVDERLPR